MRAILLLVELFQLQLSTRLNTQWRKLIAELKQQAISLLAAFCIYLQDIDFNFFSLQRARVNCWRFKEQGRFKTATGVFGPRWRNSVCSDSQGWRCAQFQKRHSNTDLVVAVAHDDDVDQITWYARRFTFIGKNINQSIYYSISNFGFLFHQL